jgi:hypothetical protein
VDQLGGAAALREDKSAQASLHQVGHQLRCLRERARALTELLVDQLGIPERDRPLGLRGAVLSDHGEVEARQVARQLAGVGDRRRGEDELRVGAVDPCKPPQAPEDVAHVRAEDAAIHVRLVDDDIPEVGEHVAPAVVVRQHAHVEHVRVGQDQVRPLADLPAALALCVAVVDRRAHVLHLQLAERPHLVLRERLRRVEVERAALRLLGQRRQHREVEGEALAARGPGRDRNVLSPAGRFPREGLVRVELADAPCLQALAQGRRKIVRKRCTDRVASRLRAEVRELLSLEQIVPLSDADGHEADGSLGLPGCLVAEAENTPVEPDPGHAGEGSRWQHRDVSRSRAPTPVAGPGSRPT